MTLGSHTHDQLVTAASAGPRDAVPVSAAISGVVAATDPFVVADSLAQTFAVTAIERDRRGGTAKCERDLLRESGLLTLTIPPRHGGRGASWSEALRIVRRFARVDGSIAHLFGFHHLLLATARLFGEERQWSRLFVETVRNHWFWGNALNPLDQRTTIRPAAPGEHVVEGTKSFCSGATDSDVLILSALDENRKLVVAAVPTGRQGIRINDDWDNMGQRQTDSGTVVFDRVTIREGEILRKPGPLGSVFASLRPCLAQLILTNVYLGLGEGALEEARHHTGRREAPRADSRGARSEDPYVLHHYGEMWVGLQGARALADAAGAALDRAWARGDGLTAEERGACALDIAVAKVSATRVGLDVANRMFDVAGARATTAAAGLDRFWRNLRTHTLHDPVDKKLRELGDWALGGVIPVPSFYS